jgi:hypothetical protein
MSEKFNGPAFKYEVGVCIATGDIVWINGPFKAGKHDTSIYKHGLRQALVKGECFEGDRICEGDSMKNPNTKACRQDRIKASKVGGLSMYS